MQNFTNVWKSLAKAKQITAADVFIYNIFRAMVAKNLSKEGVALGLLQRAFTPVTKPIKLASGRRPYDVLDKVWRQINIQEYELNQFKSKDSPTTLRECLETVEEIKLYNRLKDTVTQELGKHSKDFYTFIFVRQDLSREQQVVQSNHATLVLGSKLIDYDPTKLNFVLCGAKDLHEIEQIKASVNWNGIETVEFTETDLNNEVTAIASFPMSVSKKRCMRRYKILTY